MTRRGAPLAVLALVQLIVSGRSAWLGVLSGFVLMALKASLVFSL